MPRVRFLLMIGVTAAVGGRFVLTSGSAVWEDERSSVRRSRPAVVALPGPLPTPEEHGRRWSPVTNDPLDLPDEIIEGSIGLRLPMVPDAVVSWLSNRWASPTGGVGSRQANRLTVTTTADGGAGSLRQALIEANASPEPDTIVFAIPTSDPGFADGVFILRPTSPLPALTGGSITLDGASQITVTGPTNGTRPVIMIAGTEAGAASGLVLQSDNNVIRSLIISGFDAEEAAGIVIAGDVSGNTVTGCLIGTTADGLAAEGNTIGLRIESGARRTTIGGATPEARNVISGNGIGILITGAMTAETHIIGNVIGSSVTGAPLGNRRAGIIITDSSNNVIGGTNPGEGNTIAYQEGSGVEITGAAVNNSILGNSIFDNAGLGIDLDGDGPTLNDEGDTDTGPNNRQNFPVITEVVVRGPTVIIRGRLDTVAGDVRLEFFSTGACDSSGFGEGPRLLGALTVTGTGDPSHPVSFATELPAPAAKFFVTSTATDQAGNTSEFSACRASNTAPIANAGPDQTVDEGTVVTLDGTASRDPDGDPITFQWRQVAGPPVTLSDPTTPRPRFTAPGLLLGEATSLRLTFSLVVNDRRLSSSADTVDITVQNIVQMNDSGRSGHQLKINLATNAFEFRVARTGQVFVGTITSLARGTGDGGGLRMVGSGAGGARLDVTIDTRRGVGLAVLVVGREAFVIFSNDMRRE